LQEIRAFFDGPLLLSGAIATGRAVLAAQAAGADLAYIGSPFIATAEANAPADYKQMIVDCGAEDIIYSPAFTGIPGNYLKPSIRAAGIDPDSLGEATPETMDFGKDQHKVKAWSQIWGAGQGIGAVHDILPVAGLVDRLEAEYLAARRELALA